LCLARLTELAGHADLAAAGLSQHVLIEVRPLLDWDVKPGCQGRWPGEGDSHEPLLMRTPALAQVRGKQVEALELAICHLILSNGENRLVIPRHHPINAITMGAIARDASRRLPLDGSS
jgi:hypothetical protein